MQTASGRTESRWWITTSMRIGVLGSAVLLAGGGLALAKGSESGVQSAASLTPRVTLSAPFERGDSVCVDVNLADAVYDGCIPKGIYESGEAFMALRNRESDPWVTVGVVPEFITAVLIDGERVTPSAGIWIHSSMTNLKDFVIERSDGSTETVQITG